MLNFSCFLKLFASPWHKCCWSTIGVMKIIYFQNARITGMCTKKHNSAKWDMSESSAQEVEVYYFRRWQHFVDDQFPHMRTHPRNFRDSKSSLNLWAVFYKLGIVCLLSISIFVCHFTHSFYYYDHNILHSTHSIFMAHHIPSSSIAIPQISNAIHWRWNIVTRSAQCRLIGCRIRSADEWNTII